MTVSPNTIKGSNRSLLLPYGYLPDGRLIFKLRYHGLLYFFHLARAMSRDGALQRSRSCVPSAFFARVVQCATLRPLSLVSGSEAALTCHGAAGNQVRHLWMTFDSIVGRESSTAFSAHL
jgi:hypothetical protein